jgi:hypothetical protein
MSYRARRNLGRMYDQWAQLRLAWERFLDRLLHRA